MATKQFSIMVDEDMLRAFRAECLRHGSTSTREMARLMEEQLETWMEELTGAHPAKRAASGRLRKEDL